jgi:Type IV secretion system pilin
MVGVRYEVRGTRVVAIVAALLTGFWLIFAPVAIVNAQFDPLQAACTENPSSPACAESAAAQDPGTNQVTETVNDVANLIAIATAVVSVIVIIIAGITLVMSSGEASSVKSARDAIIYAAIGMVVVGLARTIVIFIVNRI